MYFSCFKNNIDTVIFVIFKAEKNTYCGFKKLLLSLFSALELQAETATPQRTRAQAKLSVCTVQKSCRAIWHRLTHTGRVSGSHKNTWGSPPTHQTHPYIHATNQISTFTKHLKIHTDLEPTFPLTHIISQRGPITKITFHQTNLLAHTSQAPYILIHL